MMVQEYVNIVAEFFQFISTSLLSVFLAHGHGASFDVLLKQWSFDTESGDRCTLPG